MCVFLFNPKQINLLCRLSSTQYYSKTAAKIEKRLFSNLFMNEIGWYNKRNKKCLTFGKSSPFTHLDMECLRTSLYINGKTDVVLV